MFSCFYYFADEVIAGINVVVNVDVASTDATAVLQ